MPMPCGYPLVALLIAFSRLVAAGSNSTLPNAGFPADSRVRIAGGRETRIAEIEPSEFVEYVDDAGGKRYTQVLMFTRFDEAAEHERYLKISTEDGRELTLTATHFVDERRLAADIVTGDRLKIASGGYSVVTMVEPVVARGLINPVTTAGRIIVGSIAVSTYHGPLQVGASHAALAPIRAVAKARLSAVPIHKVGPAIDCFHKAHHEGGLVTAKRCFVLPWNDAVPVQNPPE